MRPLDLASELAERLDQAGFPSPGVDARWLVAEACGLEVNQLFARWDQLSAEEARTARELVERRLSGEPVQHITGKAYFRYETLAVGPGVFIPRPETELVAGKAIELLSAREAGQRRIVELCSGSGAIVRSVVRELGGVEAFANELSLEAEPWLRRNLADTDVRIEIGDMAEAFPQLSASVDLVVVNPPYIPTVMRAQLPRDVVGYDPAMALFAGPDGLAVMPTVAATAARLLKPGGMLVVEHDESHPQAVAAILQRAGFVEVEDFVDLAGRPRFLTAVWQGPSGQPQWQDGARE